MTNATEINQCGKMKLTESQIKILEDAFSSYPAGATLPLKFATIEGIQT
jgi:hypothetical protein